MPREYKYYGSLPCFTPSQAFCAKYPTYHAQFRVVVKARSFAEANRIAKEITGQELFSRAYTSETGNKQEVELCDKYGSIIATDGTRGYDYISLEEAVNMQ